MPALLRIAQIFLVSVSLCSCVADKAYQNVDRGMIAFSPGDSQPEAHVLAHIEFDDQGWFHDIRQRQTLFNKLHAIKKANKAMLIVTYTHGWKHNASDSDENLLNFRKLLSQLSAMERAANRPKGPRTVVGVYIGWRGASVDIPLIENFTFWTRKNAAERVGTRSVKQLFHELNQYRVIANNWTEPDLLADNSETQLIFIGHSFGGLITYHAIYSAILERGLLVDELGQYRVAKSFGDFVLLVNPAFEGAAYEPIWQAALLRGCFPLSQKPVMAIVTSSADNATRYAFPTGRLYTYFQSATLPGERETVMHTVGHLDRYRTHRLSMKTGGETAIASASTEAQLTSVGQPNAQSITTVGKFELIQINTYAPARMPYLVIQAGPELIADHNDFWNDNFRDFTVQFITSQILTPPGAQERKKRVRVREEDACLALGMDGATIPSSPVVQ